MLGAFVVASCESSDAADRFAIELAGLPGVQYAIRVSGVYELIVKINADTEEQLKERVHAIRNDSMVNFSTTLMIEKSHI